MIVEEQKSTLETIGDIQQIKTTIDTENLSFLASLLSSNLYSKPVSSFLREIVSNAWDSHVAAHTEDKPVIINFRNGSVTIRDYGTGLSKEEFETVYCKIGTSTKRASNNYIGCFGIGKWSMLAIKDVAFITSYYNNMKYEYIITKEDGIIISNLINEESTTEHNGLSITLNDLDWNIHEQMEKDIMWLTFFPNLFVSFHINKSEEDLNCNINKDTVMRYKHFSVSRHISRHCGYHDNLFVLLGNVLYPVDTMALKYDASDSDVALRASTLKSIKACLNMDIGSIKVTPSREAILYDETTCKAIKTKISEAYDELKEHIKKAKHLEINDVMDIFNIIASYNMFWDPTEDKLDQRNNSACCYPIHVREMDLYFKGKKIDDNQIELLRSINCSNLPNAISSITDGVISKANRASITYNRFIVVKKGTLLNAKMNYYLRYITKGKREYTPIVWHLNPEEFRRCYTYKDILLDDVIAQELYKHYMECAIFVKDEDVNSHYETVLAERELKRTANKGVPAQKKYTLHELGLDYRYYTYSISIKMFTYNENFFKEFPKKGKVILFRGKNNKPSNEECKALRSLGYRLFYVKRTTYDDLYSERIANPNFLSNVKFEYNPDEFIFSSFEEKVILLCEFISKCERKGISQSTFFHILKYNIIGYVGGVYGEAALELLKFTDYTQKNIITTCLANNTSMLSLNYTPKTYEGKRFQEMLNTYITTLVYAYKFKFDETSRFMGGEALTCYSRYLFLKTCIKNKIMVKPNCFKSIKDYSLIKFLKETL